MSAPIAVLTQDQLADLLAKASAMGVEEFLKRTGMQAPGPAELTPSQVREMARCSSQEVFDAIKAGELPTRQEARPARGAIPAFARFIERADAEAWVANRIAQRTKRRA